MKAVQYERFGGPEVLEYLEPLQAAEAHRRLEHREVRAAIVRDRTVEDAR
jgi:hypothetical protein